MLNERRTPKNQQERKEEKGEFCSQVQLLFFCFFVFFCGCFYSTFWLVLLPSSSPPSFPFPTPVYLYYSIVLFLFSLLLSLYSILLQQSLSDLSICGKVRDKPVVFLNRFVGSIYVLVLFGAKFGQGLRHMFV